MGVNKKHRRSILYKNRLFYWYVLQDNEDFDRIKLNIISDDKRFIVSYQVGQSKQNDNPHIVIKGSEFKGLNETKSTWRRVLTPKWDDEIITPSFVSKLIDWCLSDKKEITLIDWQGNIIDRQLFK